MSDSESEYEYISSGDEDEEMDYESKDGEEGGIGAGAGAGAGGGGGGGDQADVEMRQKAGRTALEAHEDPVSLSQRRKVSRENILPVAPDLSRQDSLSYGSLVDAYALRDSVRIDVLALGSGFLAYFRAPVP